MYRRQDGSEAVNWLDVSRLEDDKIPLGLSRTTVLSRFHVIGANDTIFTGAAGFLALWKVLPKFQRFARLVDFPQILFVFEIGYTIFLFLRPLVQRLTPTPSCCSNEHAGR